MKQWKKLLAVVLVAGTAMTGFSVPAIAEPAATVTTADNSSSVDEEDTETEVLNGVCKDPVTNT